jgi:hypothetical protein
MKGRGIRAWLRRRWPGRSGTFWRDHSLDVIGIALIVVFTITALSPFYTKGVV